MKYTSPFSSSPKDITGTLGSGIGRFSTTRFLAGWYFSAEYFIVTWSTWRQYASVPEATGHGGTHPPVKALPTPRRYSQRPHAVESCDREWPQEGCDHSR